jgi:hypothetical protein
MERPKTHSMLEIKALAKKHIPNSYLNKMIKVPVFRDFIRELVFYQLHMLESEQVADYGQFLTGVNKSGQIMQVDYEIKLTSRLVDVNNKRESADQRERVGDVGEKVHPGLSPSGCVE